MRKRPVWKIFFVLALSCALMSEFVQHVLKRPEEKQAEYAQQQIRHLENKMMESLRTIATFSADSQYHEYFIHSGKQNDGFSFYYFENGTLQRWSDNDVTLPEQAGIQPFADGTRLNLPDGIYEAFEKDSGEKKILGLILLRKNFAYENKYLVNHFNSELHLDNQFQVATVKPEYNIYSITGKPLLQLAYSRIVPDTLPVKVPALFYLAAFLFFTAAVFFFFRTRSAGILSVILTGLFLFLLRWLMIAFRLPGELYYNDFFSPKAYGSSYFFNSLGDFFLNADFILVFAGIFFENRKRSSTGSDNKISFALVLSALLIIVFGYALHELLTDLVQNSKISFETGVADLSINTLAAVMAMLMMLYAYYLGVRALLLPYRFSFGKRRMRLSSLQLNLFALFILSAYASLVIIANAHEKKVESQKIFAQRLDERQDELAEYLFSDVREKITGDTLVVKMLHQHNGAQRAITYLQQNYFGGYFAKFDAEIFLYDSSGVSRETSQGISLTALQDMYENEKPSALGTLEMITDESGKMRYLSLIPLVNDDSTSVGTLAVILNAKPMQPTEGFPELLVSSNFSKSRDEGNYSYARYANGALVYAGGNFPYAFHATGFDKNKNEFSQLSSGGYEHLIYRPSASSLIVVSRPEDNFFDDISLFSYVLLFFLIMFLAVQVLFYFDRKWSFQLSLKQRIRSALISLVVISFALIAAGTSVYIVRKYDDEKNKNILARLNALWFAITDHVTDGNGAGQMPGISQDDLRTTAANFNLDFNVYDSTGNLFYSSQPKLFDQGILSRRANPEALFEMQQFGQTQFVHPESIGRLNYVAAYAPLTGHSGNIAGYLNLPYFEKQNDLNKEISGFLSALISIYLLLLVVSLLLALIITSRITKPLLLIQEKLSRIRIGSRNEVIEWKRNDEIGQLVSEYNKMVEALAESAALLAQSERESAWREMAQQVAHEIKNPLTPMKLSVQHLQRAWKEKSGNLEDLFERISTTIIEQIDALSNIASAFSNFAKMPRPQNETLDLHELLLSSINLFKAVPDITITLEDDGPSKKIFADRGQLLRAFSNLIKNAMQAIPEGRAGKIRISVTVENNFYVIAIADNGTGIPVSLRQKVFTPSFTTKTSGMGLGLAMVKSTAEASGGTIRFETEEGKGSVFIMSLPASLE